MARKMACRQSMPSISSRVTLRPLRVTRLIFPSSSSDRVSLDLATRSPRKVCVVILL